MSKTLLFIPAKCSWQVAKLTLFSLFDLNIGFYADTDFSHTEEQEDSDPTIAGHLKHVQFKFKNLGQWAEVYNDNEFHVGQVIHAHSTESDDVKFLERKACRLLQMAK